LSHENKYITPYENKGFCCCCDRDVLFKTENVWYRDYYKCSNCGSIPRHRAIMHIIETLYPDWEGAYIHESSPSEGGASAKIKRLCNNYIASQFYMGKKPGEYEGLFRNEDLSNQSFDNEIFDMVVTQDVLEHVFNAEKVFCEIARTLKPEGFHIFTVPLVNKEKPTEKTAEINKDGTLTYFTPPEYHGNPIDCNGSLVTYKWGYDIVDIIQKSCNMVSEIYTLDDIGLGIRAEYIDVIVSRKQ